MKQVIDTANKTAGSPENGSDQKVGKAGRAAKRGRIQRELLRTLPLLILAMAAIGAAGSHAGKVNCNSFKIEVQHVEGMYFTDASAIQKLLLQRFDVMGTPMQKLPLAAMHATLLERPSVARAVVVPHLSGTLEIQIQQHKPVARIITPTGSRYLESQGGTMPLSTRYTAAVPIIHCPDAQSADWATPLLDRMRVDPFWDAMIDQIAVNAEGEIDLYPRVGNLVIHLGGPAQHATRLDQQLQYIQRFYRAQVATGDLRKFKKLDLSYTGQIVAHK
jgi:cell division protein FtsQ